MRWYMASGKLSDLTEVVNQEQKTLFSTQKLPKFGASLIKSLTRRCNH